MSSVRMVTLDIGGQRLWLLPERAAFLPDSDTLVVADAYIGDTGGSLALLSDMVRRLEVSRIVFLGDFLSAARADPATMTDLMEWRDRHRALELTMVRSPFDPTVVEPPSNLDLQARFEPVMHFGLALRHRPQPVHGAFVLAGHSHPCVNVRSRTQSTRRLPCYCFTPNVGILPAFGTAIGMQAVKPSRSARVFAIRGERVLELPLKTAERPHRTVPGALAQARLAPPPDQTPDLDAPVELHLDARGAEPLEG